MTDVTRRATGWHRLRVRSVEPLTDDAVAVSLEVPEALAGVFAHRPGQHVTVRHVLDGRELRRSYSVCPPPPPGACGGLRLVVKRLGAGGFAEYATGDLAAGDHLELAPPTGDFRLVARPGAHHVLIAAGSGITPLLSMAQAALRDDRACRVSLVYANRTARSVLLADELADLKDAHPGRFFVLHVLSRETRESDLLSGRVDAGRLPGLLALLGAEPGDDAYFYLCGPWGLVAEARAALTAWGAGPERVRFELFSAGTALREGPDDPAPASGGTAGRITARLGGRTTVTTMEPADRTVLDALLRARPELPYSCRDGLCGSCRARVTAGRVTLGRQYALGADELAAGYTLACRARPESDEIEFDFDA
ncbi:2Fe-2S iron-sulfur cluster binding domain-containing protein [Streptomyces sp. NA02950]|uniref:2Fe-2S iron-sulfur cluster-binding protein n=1 Tax=Streptomyces sp. NA02950 TaxID=2742137 RepID=UPI0015923305|nr:2Fe-2S iron-sulfur cluster-binding protein [Streptomyces sp. NA02950]QKV96254.1 2Fe-2S iron-sulfur cluster binding domain-containing protein [Streptomyces sp. NA02950]